jgi:hypothetical protein
MEPVLIHPAYGGPLDGGQLYDQEWLTAGARTIHDMKRCTHFYEFDGSAWRYVGAEKRKPHDCDEEGCGR